MSTKIEHGNAAEALACRYLEAQGLELVVRNFRCRVGELDLIMRDGEHLVFVEVRSRGGFETHYGTPAESVTRAKQRRLIRAASYYLQKTRADVPCRFDVIAVHELNEQGLEWIKDAFQAG